MNKKKKILLIMILIILVIGGYTFYRYKNATASNILTLFGNIEIRQVDMSFQVSGQIEGMFFEEGDVVQGGDLIAKLDDKDYVVNLQKATAQVAKSRAIKANADDIYGRNTPLCEDDTVSKTECEAIKHRKEEAAANLKSAIAQERFAQNQLNYTKMYAPDEGVITVRIQEPGATVQPGQAIYTISKNKPIWIRVYVSEENLGNIAYNMGARVLTDSIDPETGKKREYVGRIGYISPVAEFTPKTVQTEDLRTDLVYRIRVYIDEVDDFLRQGMPVTVKIDMKNGLESGVESDKSEAR